MVILFKRWVVLQMSADSFADHGVLAHENDGMVAEGATDLLQLLRADVISAHDEALRVFVEELLGIQEPINRLGLRVE